jgi:NDP-sugar pyrophosphorylase family protein
MTPVGPEPSIYYVLSRLSQEGFDEIVIVVRGSQKNQIMAYLGDGSKMGLRVTYIVEPDGLPIGTAGSLKLCEHLLDDTFIVAQADTLTEIPLRGAVDLHRNNGALATIVLTRVQDPSAYGVAVLDERGVISEFQEKPQRKEAKSNLVSTGFYVMEPESLDYVMDNAWDFAKDFFPWLLGIHKKLAGFVSDAFWVDIGELEGYLRGVNWVIETMTRGPGVAPMAERSFAVMGDTRALSDAILERSAVMEGASIGQSAQILGPAFSTWEEGQPFAVMEDSRASSRPAYERSVVMEGAWISHSAQIVGPAFVETGVTIEDEARIGQSCAVMRNSRISSRAVLERSVVMEGASIGRNCTIRDSVIGQSATLHDNVVVNESIIGPGCDIGEGVSVLRGSRIWPGVRVGNDQRVKGIVSTPLDKAFYCFTDVGQYTGLLATSVEGFIDALEKSPIQSIEFHVKRRDYERWARDVLALNDLADGFEELRRKGVTGEELRRGLIGNVKWASGLSDSES